MKLDRSIIAGNSRFIAPWSYMGSRGWWVGGAWCWNGVVCDFKTVSFSICGVVPVYRAWFNQRCLRWTAKDLRTFRTVWLKYLAVPHLSRNHATMRNVFAVLTRCPSQSISRIRKSSWMMIRHWAIGQWAVVPRYVTMRASLTGTFE